MAKLIISRRKEWSNRARKFNIYVDGKLLDVIGHNEIKEFELDSGTHNVLLKVDWCSSPKMEFELNNDQSKSFEVSIFKLMRWVYPLLYGIFSAFLLLKWVFEIYIQELVYVAIPLFLILVYYFSFGRKKYIEINEL
ncbi:MAG: hypothetical protein JEY96_13190 [Bacteroidales bacterium]|nr:hypothetical protein [Bacteroidales bacterium]